MFFWLIKVWCISGGVLGVTIAPLVPAELLVTEMEATVTITVNVTKTETNPETFTQEIIDEENLENNIIKNEIRELQEEELEELDNHHKYVHKCPVKLANFCIKNGLKLCKIGKMVMSKIKLHPCSVKLVIFAWPKLCKIGKIYFQNGKNRISLEKSPVMRELNV